MMIDSPADAERRVQLRRMKSLATGLLVFAAIIYLATLGSHRQGTLGWVNAGAEAAMVGALADWFAVTALFRHPLGLPIPHTALIKERKNELGASLQQFVTDNFLTVEVLTDHVAQAELPRRAGEWLNLAANRQVLVGHLARGLEVLLGRVRDEEVTRLVDHTLLPRLRSVAMSPMAGELLADVVEQGSHQQLVDILAREAHDWLGRHPDTARQVIVERAPSWSPRWLDKTVVSFGYQQALEWTMAVRMQPNHPARQALDGFLERLAQDLQTDAPTMARAEALKERLLGSEAIAPALLDLWHGSRDSFITSLHDESSSLRLQADDLLTRLGGRLRDEPELRAQADERIGRAVGFLVDTYGPQLATVISATVDRWDADEAGERIELFVGRDLQFIRINGTVVGCLAGLTIHALSLLV